jgi:hypothetical protein
MKGYHQELDLIQRQIETHFDSRLAAIDGERQSLEAERADALEAIARLRRALSMNGLKSIEGLDLASFQTKPARTLTEAVVTVIRDFIAGDFTINTVIELVGRHHPEIKQPINPTSVSGILRTLKEEGILELVKEGAGPRAAVYKVDVEGRKYLGIQNEFRLELSKE